ncbi:type III polyketide synthase [Streptomyces sp. NPDC020490]|uniref:type III polyketide synthase n=1 Tax=Streptomyces sp. NPDC020490 TaxID=3365078 RepID=UPI00379FDE47
MNVFTAQHGPTQDPARRGPAILSVETALPAHCYTQEEITAEFCRALGLTGSKARAAASIHGNSGISRRYLGLPLEKYEAISGFTEANAIAIDVALELGEQALRSALDAAGVMADEVDALVFTSGSVLAVPSVDTMLAARLGFRRNVKRFPLFGLACSGGAAGIGRLHDYLHAWPDQVAVLLAVEPLSLTAQAHNFSMASIVGGGLFGDGAAAVVAAGAGHRLAGGAEKARISAGGSRLYPEVADITGSDIGSDGLSPVLRSDVPLVVEQYIPEAVGDFLAECGLKTDDVATWVCHPGGPKVLQAMQRGLGVPEEALRHSWESLSEVGNLSGVSVLDILRRTLAASRPTMPAVLMAMGPGFSFDFALLS